MLPSLVDGLVSDILYKSYFYIVMLLSILGAYLTSGNSKKLRGLGFIIWTTSNFAIGYDYYLNQNYPMTFTFLVYELFNIRGAINNLPKLKFWNQKKEYK